MFEKNCIHYRVFGVGECTSDAVNKINALNRKSLSAKVVIGDEFPEPKANDLLALILVDGDTENADSLAQLYADSGVFRMIITTGNEVYDTTSATHVETKEDLFKAAKAILDILFNQQIIALGLHDIAEVLSGNGHFRIIEEVGHTKCARVQDAINKIEPKLLPLQDDENIERDILIALYTRQDAHPALKITELSALSEFIAKLPSDLNVIWGEGYDNTITDDSVKMILLVAGDKRHKYDCR